MNQEGHRVGRKHVRTLMRRMGIEAIYRRKNTSRPHPEHAVFPYLLRGLCIDRANQVWCADALDRRTPDAVYFQSLPLAAAA